MRTHAPRQVMKAPDMFLDSIQTFDKKTGQRISYGSDRELFEQEPEPTKEEKDPEQMNLFDL